MNNQVIAKQRNPAIELYRVMLMFGICLLHAMTQCGHDNPHVSSLLMPCVDGFVLISGWFGIGFNFGRVRRLAWNSCYAGLASILLIWMISSESLALNKDTLKSCIHIMFGQWFFVSYLALMLFAPAINYIIDNADRKSAKNIIIPLVALLLWNWLSTIPHLRIMPRPEGFGSYTPLTLVTIYVIGRLVNKIGILKAIPNRCAACVALMLLALFSLLPQYNLSTYASPFAMVVALIFLKFFLSMPKSRALGIWGGVAPSMFTVYIFHSHRMGFDIMTQYEQFLIDHGCSVALSYLAVALTVFALGVVVDIPRRCISKMSASGRIRI